MTSRHAVYQSYLTNRISPYYNWLKFFIEHLEQDTTQQEYVALNTESLVKKINKTEPNKKLTPTNLSRVLIAAMELSELKEEWGNDFFKTGRGNGKVYHLKVSTVLPSLKKFK